MSFIVDVHHLIWPYSHYIFISFNLLDMLSIWTDNFFSKLYLSDTITAATSKEKKSTVLNLTNLIKERS